MFSPTPPMHQKHSTQSHNTHRATRPRQHIRPSHTLIKNTRQHHLELRWSINGGRREDPALEPQPGMSTHMPKPNRVTRTSHRDMSRGRKLIPPCTTPDTQQTPPKLCDITSHIDTKAPNSVAHPIHPRPRSQNPQQTTRPSHRETTQGKEIPPPIHTHTKHVMPNKPH